MIQGKAKIKDILIGLRERVIKGLPDILISVKKVEDILFEFEGKQHTLSPTGTLEFTFNKDVRIVRKDDEMYLEDFTTAPLNEVVSFEFTIFIKLVRHHPTSLVISAGRAFSRDYLKTIELLSFDDCLHMESEEHHSKILEKMAERLNGIDFDKIAKEIEQVIASRVLGE